MMDTGVNAEVMRMLKLEYLEFMFS